MMRGRRPKPTHIKILEGNPGKRPLPDGEPIPRPIAPEPPDMSAEALAVWRELAPAMERTRQLTEVDGPAFEIMCGLVAVWRDVDDDKIGLRLCKILRGYFSMFGLSPEDRMRLGWPRRGSDESES